MAYRVGQTATNPKTGQKVQWDGSNWVSINGPVAQASGGATGGKLSQTTEKFFNELSTQAADAQEAQRIYERAAQQIGALRPGPYRGRMMEVATPEDGGGFLDTLGAAVIGGPLRLTGAITPSETEAFQKMRGYQSEQVLNKQLLQKGPQTESDAARLQLTELSPSKDGRVNMDIINAGKDKARRAQARAIWTKRFAQKYGLNGRTPEGYTADELWAKSADHITQKLLGSGRATSGGAGKNGIKVISRTKVR